MPEKREKLMELRTTKKYKRTFAIVVAIIAWCAVLVMADSVSGKISLSDTNLEKLNVTYTGNTGSGNWRGSDGLVKHQDGTDSFTVTVKSAFNNPLFGNASYPESSMTITLKNLYEVPATLKFSYNATSANGIITVDTVQSNKGSFEKEIPGGGDITIKIVSSDNKAGHESGVVFELTNLSLKQVEITATTTFMPGEHGSYTVDGDPVKETMTKNKSSLVPYKLAATADTGYVFFGWRNLTTESYISINATDSIGIAKDCTIQPVFISEKLAQFSVGSQVFWDLNEANAYAHASKQPTKTIVLIREGVIPVGQYTISSDVTLLIPYSTSTEVHQSPVTVGSASTSYAYRTLTIQQGTTLTVNGAINVDGQILNNPSRPTGPYGLIKLERDAYINLENGSALYCWGYINGDGMVDAKGGSKVYECFQLTGWRGGTQTLKMIGNLTKHVFPVNQYYVQNIESALKLNYNSREYVYASVVVNTSDQYDIMAEFISPSAGMFRLQEDGSYIIKKYVSATDRMYFEVNGKLLISSMTMKFSSLYSLKTADSPLPINSNFTINIYSGTTTIDPNQDIALLPGAEFTVSNGAIFDVQSNMYVYDQTDWMKGKYAYKFGGGACYFAPIHYTTTNGTEPRRTIDDLKSAMVYVNGTMKITGKIYTTAAGANIFSTDDEGKIIFKQKADTGTKTTYQCQDNNSIVGITCYPAKLRNGREPYYTETAGAQAGWTYKYDTVQQRWYRFRVNYQFNGKDIGYDLITTDTTTRDVSNYVSDNSSLVGKVTSGMADTPTISGGTLTVTGVRSDCTINIEGVAASYTPYFVLNEHQYGVYLSYGGTKITNKVTIAKKTYYVVKSCGTMKFGAELSAPSADTMGVSDANHNSITWFLEDVTTGAQQFMNTVPSGKNKGEPVYIYGIYTGAVAYNSYTDKYYTNLKDAIVALPVTGSATLTMYANCGTFEDESKTASYSLSANITFDVNGKEVWGSLVNNGTLTLDLNGGSVRYITGATAGSTSYRASAAVINNGTMTIQDSQGGGVISTDAISDNGSLQNYAVAVRNQGNGTLSMNNVTVATTQTVNDASSAVLNYNGGVITSMNNCSVVCTRGYGITNYGGTIQTISGGTINGGDAATAGQYGIQNRNIRSGSGTEAAPYVISKLGTIDTISGLTVYVYQHGLINYATVNCITGNTSITTAGNYAIRNMAGWYYDTQIIKGTPTDANNVKTTVYTFDTENFPTIKEISGNVTVTTTGAKSSYAIWNSGNIEKISGDMNGDGILITRPDGSYTLENSGYIGEISGKVTIYSSGEYVLMQNIWGSSNARQIGQTYIQKDVNKDGTYTSVGDIREYTYEYTAPVIDKIGGGNSKVTISGTKNVLYNFGTINAITDGVTVTARTEDTRTDSNALLNGHSGGGYKTNRSVRTNMGKDALTNRFETRLEEERTYYQAKIGSIVGDVTIECKTSSALRNGGIIDSIGSGVTIKAANNALKNTGYTFSQFQNVSLRYYASEAFRTDNSEASGNYAYTATTPVITLIDGPTIQATSGSYAIENGGTIETIQNANISAKSYRAIHNASNVITDRKIYKDNTHTTTYALTELFDAFFTENANTGKYTAVAGDATPNHVDSYGAIPTITLIGAGNTISAAKQPIYNQGEITRIDSGSDAKTSIITATDQAGEGQAIFNFSALAGTKTFTDGRSGVYGDYKTPAHIGTIRNVNVTAAYRAIQNGNDGSYLNVIDEIGVGAQVTSNTNGEAVYNASKNAQIKSIKNGTYTAATAGHYAVYNAGTTYAITIEGGYFKGGLSSSANRDHAIYQPDEPKRQTYPEGRTLSNKPNKDGYYYIAENKFTIRYDSNGSTSDPVTGSVADQEFTLPQSNVALRSNSYTRENWEFAGWALDMNTGAESNALLRDTATPTQLGDPGAGDVVTLYAIWRPNKSHSVTVSWNSDKLLYNYQPNVYEWNAQKLCYELKTPAYWDGNHSVTITNTGEVNNTKYGKVNVGISYTNTNTSYSGFSMKYYNPDTQVEFTGTDSSNNLAKALDPGGFVKAQLKLIGDLPTDMASGTNIKIGRVTLTLTTAD